MYAHLHRGGGVSWLAYEEEDQKKKRKKREKMLSSDRYRGEGKSSASQGICSRRRDLVRDASQLSCSMPDAPTWVDTA